MSARARVPTSRAEAVAAQEGYGARLSSHRVNRAHDRRLATGALMLPIGAAVFLGMAWAASPWSDGGGSIPGMLPSGVAGLAFLALTIYVAFPLLVAMFRVKGAWVHVFARGAIAERPQGNLYAWALPRATVRYVCWQESWEGELRDRPQIWVRFRDGETICFDGLALEDRGVLPDVARAFGIGEHPERIGTLHPAKAPTPF
ncbi:hypothetical protein [Streptomyces sp. PT12]|uniref:hypothetical protein n=1 Tax=Streptomyces sp. PT12 TaxID=1510197 RepID=UPI000DE41E5E|nr:hypothetical protein [Streptomyces sp. PT12]RBM18690.1 hypothetical protein DEH69_12335 [Streptomyces sp. PT12]